MHNKRRERMKKSVIIKLGVVALAVLLISGCQIGATDQELINATMTEWKEALIAQDLDKLMETYSEDFEGEMSSGKEETREFMAEVFEQGYVDGAEVDLEAAETTIEGDRAEFSGVELMLDTGPMTLDFTLQKEEQTWLIVGSESDE
jgi:ketosteroid isomerase-like protein